MVAEFVTWIHQDPMLLVSTLGYAGIALFVFAESGVLLGIFLPGDSLLFAAGLLAAGGFFSIGPLVLLVVLAAVVGDSVGYWFGRKVGTSLFSRPDSRFFKQEYVRRTEAFYEKYGGRALVLARFVPIVRTLAPILAGVGSMNYRQFVLFNAFGGLLWGAGVVLLGYFLGILIPNSGDYILPISLGIIVLSVLPIALDFIRNKRTAA
ncbi:MAG: VTT domain-containing protein [Candidatus Paceibacterota bacterium]